MRHVPTHYRHFAVAIAVSACVHCPSILRAQDDAAPQTATEQTEPTDEAVNGDHHSPELGVLVGSCPGEGVCVIDTLRGGPADRVGVEPGDYILAINDQTVSNPQELKKKIESLSSDDTIDLNLWRQGKYVNKEVRLAKESATLPESHRGWLGVVLAPAPEGGEGATIREVASDSPAEKAGLQRGDEIIKLNGNQVESLEQFVNDVSDFEPGKEIQLGVRRDGSEQEITAELGQVIEAPVQWFRNRMPARDGFPGFSMPGMPAQPAAPLMDEMLNDMRRQIRVLRQEVDQLKAAAPAAKEAEKATPPDDDVSFDQNERSVTPQQTTVQRIPSQANLRSRLVLAQAQPNISNDWSGARYTSPAYQGWRDNQRQPSAGYNGTYTYPYYNYGNGNYGYGYNGYRGYNGYNNYRYYQYGGRPYYYGGGYPYGYRGGVRFGTGLGVYW